MSARIENQPECENCLSPYIPARPEQRHCSRMCAGIATARAVAEKDIAMRYPAAVCEECRVAYQPASPHSTLCYNVACRSARKLRQAKERNERRNASRALEREAAPQGLGDAPVSERLRRVVEAAGARPRQKAARPKGPPRTAGPVLSCSQGCKHARPQSASDTGWECRLAASRACNPWGDTPKFFEVMS